MCIYVCRVDGFLFKCRAEEKERKEERRSFLLLCGHSHTHRLLHIVIVKHYSCSLVCTCESLSLFAEHSIVYKIRTMNNGSMAVMDYKLYTILHHALIVGSFHFCCLHQCKKREMNRRYKSVRSLHILVSAKVVTSCRWTLYNVMFKWPETLSTVTLSQHSQIMQIACDFEGYSLNLISQSAYSRVSAWNCWSVKHEIQRRQAGSHIGHVLWVKKMSWIEIDQCHL